MTAAVMGPGTIKDAILTTAPVLARLPLDVDDALRSLLRGDLRARVSLLSEPEDVRWPADCSTAS